MCQVTEECQSSQLARSLVMQPDQLVLCPPHNLTTPGYGTITLAATNQLGSKTDTWQVWVGCDTQKLTYMQLGHCNATYKDVISIQLALWNTRK
jgi:hypothetical protein